MYYKKGTYLMHYGVLGQKWGTRRYQNPDGSLTPEGREHYGLGYTNGEAQKYSGKHAKLKYMAESKWEKNKLSGRIRDEYRSNNIKNMLGDIGGKQWRRNNIDINNEYKAGKKAIDDYLVAKYGSKTAKDVKRNQIIGRAVAGTILAGLATVVIVDKVKSSQTLDDKLAKDLDPIYNEQQEKAQKRHERVEAMTPRHINNRKEDMRFGFKSDVNNNEYLENNVYGKNSAKHNPYVAPSWDRPAMDRPPMYEDWANQYVDNRKNTKYWKK